MMRLITENFTDRDELLDDPRRITQYRAVGLAEGLMKGSEDDVLWAWQWLGDHPQFTNRLQACCASGRRTGRDGPDQMTPKLSGSDREGREAYFLAY